jgi:hypothetical protein
MKNIRRKIYRQSRFANRCPSYPVKSSASVMRGRRGAGGGARAAERDARGAAIKSRIPVWSQKTMKNQTFTKNRAARPRALAAQARAMFLSNIHIKNDMDCFT